MIDVINVWIQSYISQYIYYDSKLLEPVGYFTEPVLTGLWYVRQSRDFLRSVWAEQHAVPARKESNVPK